MDELTATWFNQLPVNNLSAVKAVSGGDINLAYQVTADNQRYFLKVQPHQSKHYFDHEINGLTAIGQVINTPTPLKHGEIEGNAFLLLNWLDSTDGNQEDLGQAVATMHQQTHNEFGFVDNHQTKALVKNNAWNPSWVDFYVNQRLLPEVEVAVEHGRWNRWRQEHFTSLVDQFKSYYQNHEVVPRLLHGDLWAGNFMFAGDHQPYLIDPDSFYGDREFDLAMTTVFGGFNEHFYRAYSKIFPFDDGLNQRLSWYRFYYLCMHLILFGESYGGAVDHILGQY